MKLILFLGGCSLIRVLNPSPPSHRARSVSFSLVDRGILAFGLVFWLCLSIWARPMALPDEGRYVGVAWEMAQSGQWGVPTLDGLPFFHKPPLFYWITAFSLKMLGFHAATARVASVLGGCLAIGSVVALTWRWASPALARRVLAVAATTPLLFLASQYANLDMLVAGCITATVALAAHACLLRMSDLENLQRVEKQKNQARRALWGAYAMAALGVLAKGLIGAVIPAASLLLWLAWQRQWRLMARLFDGVGCFVFLGLAAPWFLLMERAFPDFFHYFFVVQHFQRFATQGFNNVQPLWFYPAVLFLFCLPWTLVSAWQLVKRWRAPQRAAHDQGLETTSPRLNALMGCTVLVVLVFFSLPASKLVGYVLPAAAPLAFLMAQSLSGLSTKRFKIWVILSGLLGLILVAFFTLEAPKSTQALGEQLRRERTSDEPVYMWHHYYYDLPLYAQLPSPARVVGDWSGEAIRAHDNWQRELVDARDFATALNSAHNLIEVDEFHQQLCAAPRAWILASEQEAQSDPWLSPLKITLKQNQTALLRWELDAGNSAQKSSALCSERLTH